MPYKKYIDSVCRMDPNKYRTSHSETAALVMRKASNLTVEYAPFDYIARNAELAVVGLTPGRTQAANAIEALAKEVRAGAPIEVALANAKRVASFSGPMRANFLAMLDAIGVPALFSRHKAAEFFAEADGLTHFTSALRYPVYCSGENYSGNPTPLSHPILREMIETYLREEASALPQAVWIPLGRDAENALLYLAERGWLNRDAILAGLPHPSGANAERIAYFLGSKARADLSQKTSPSRLDDCKAKLLAQITKLRAQRRIS